MAVTVVELTWREIRMAAMAGIDRRLMDLHRGCSDRNDAPSESLGWQMDVQGVIAEFAVAKAMDVYWGGSDPRLYRQGDVARLQVRSTVRDDGCLIVHDDDPSDAAFVLVVGMPPRLRIPGWIRGGDAKQERWWRTDIRTPAFLVPQAALRSIDEFVDVTT